MNRVYWFHIIIFNTGIQEIDAFLAQQNLAYIKKRRCCNCTRYTATTRHIVLCILIYISSVLSVFETRSSHVWIINVRPFTNCQSLYAQLNRSSNQTKSLIQYFTIRSSGHLKSDYTICCIPYTMFLPIMFPPLWEHNFNSGYCRPPQDILPV